MSDVVKSAKRVVFQGEPGSFSQQAAREAVPHAEPIARPTFDAAIEALVSGEADLGMIPIENSLHGRIADIHHMLPNVDLHIVGEHFLRVRMQLMGVESATLESIKTVISQEPAIGQCRKIIKDLKLKVQLWADTAGSARHVAELKDPSIAAIASKLAAEIHKLKILKPDIEDASHNVTRFLIMSAKNEIAPNTGDVMTSFIFRVRNVPAALYKALGGFATNGVNMTKLESYQLEGSFAATQFYADIEGHPEDKSVKLALEELGYWTASLKILGTYPASPFRKTVKA